MRHLYSNRCHDEAEVWCADVGYFADLVEPAIRPEDADCDACLLAAFEFGVSAMRRRLFLKDGRILEKHQAIEKVLEYMAHPVFYVRPAGGDEP